MLRRYNLNAPDYKDESRPSWYFKTGLIVSIFIGLWYYLPRFKVQDEPLLMSDRELLEKIPILISFQEAAPNPTRTDKRLAQLGKKFFFDKRFSANENISCSSCHKPEFSFADNQPISMGIGVRNTPPIFNLAESDWFFWDGRSDSLASQTLEPLLHVDEMNISITKLIKLISEHYKADYEKIFGKIPRSLTRLNTSQPALFPAPEKLMSIEMAAYGLSSIASYSILNKILVGSAKENKAPAMLLAEFAFRRSLKEKKHLPLGSHKTSKNTREDLEKFVINIGLALESYQLGLVSKSSPFDLFLERLTSTRDVSNSLTDKFGETELDGLKVFLGQGKCSLCHNGTNFTNQSFHNIGLGINEEIDSKQIPVGRAQGVLDVLSSQFNCKSTVVQQARRETSLQLNPNNSVCDELEFLDTENLEIMGAFKTPTLRNLARTKPYMRDGRFSTIEEVVEHYNELSTRPAIGHREESLTPLGLSEKRKANLVAFLKSLTSPVVDLSEKK